MARTRALYTGEKLVAARAGIARDHSMGLDTCRPEQHELRALLGLGYLNHGFGHNGPAVWGLAALSSYTLTVSPRFDRLVLITKAPDNVALRLLRGPTGGSALPGLRIEECRGHGSYVLRHLPTTAQLVITNNPSGAPVGARRDAYFDSPTTETPLTAEEQRHLDRTADIASDARRLLSGIFCRITIIDPDGTWAIGNWYCDPLMRPGRRESFSLSGHRRLRGAKNTWELEWASHPHPDDLISALTDPVIGIPGARQVSVSGSPAITLGNATLRLHSRHG
ncbi:conserved hypothetical protein [Streptomyces clavuligerus]|nr:conserved hypothetical protein [Streptomyces clavuligerus]